MQLFYNSELTELTKQLSFDKEESKHIVKVLRKKIGDNLHITNGLGAVFLVEITSDNFKKCQVKIINFEVQPPLAYSLHLAVAPTKMNDRYEWFLEKATEIGVTEITPILCENSERHKINLERFNRILQSALKQSLQAHLPKLNAPVQFSDFLKHTDASQKYIAHCDNQTRVPLKKLASTKTDILICIGPEGDFSTNEITSALQSGFKPVTLGNTRLRTETAAVVSCHTIALIHE